MRAVRPGIVLEVAFDTVERSSRHKCGLVLRGARIERIHHDMPVDAAQSVSAIAALIDED